MRKVEDVKEIQAMGLRILKAFDEFCRENHLEYYLAFGTLIGSIRHGGFIPWDDDVDVWMKREDYDLLVERFPAFGKARGLYLNSPETEEKYNRVFAKICLENTRLESLDRHNDFREGYYIDVFVLDGVPDQKLARSLRVRRLQVLRNLGTIAAYGADQLPGAGRKEKLYGALSKCFGWVDQNAVARRYATVASKDLCSGSKYLQVTCAKTKGKNVLLPADWFDTVEEKPFEDMTAMVPGGYDAILRQIYGDYMQLPPEEKRVSHHHFVIYAQEESCVSEDN